MDVIFVLASSVATFAIGLGGFAFSAYFKRMSPGDAVSAVREFFLSLTQTDSDYLRLCRQRQLSVILSAASVVSLANVFNVIIVAWLLMRSVGDITVYLWAFLIALMSMFHAAEVLDLVAKGVQARNSQRKIRRIVRNVTLFGIVWGSAGFLFIDDIVSLESLIVLIALIGTASGGAAAMGVLPQASVLFVAAIGGPAFYRLLTLGSGEYALIAVYEASLIFVLGAVSSSLYDVIIKEPSLAAVKRKEQRAAVLAEV
ncbi:MAG: hypothetical protein AAB227_07325 [Pseudomonadota bacterium]